MNKSIALIFAIFPLASFASDCPENLPQISIVGGSAFERKAACEGLERATRFFTEHKLAPKLDSAPLTIHFHPEVFTPCQDANPGPACKGPRVAALFDASTFTIHATSANAPWMKRKDRTYFKLQYDQELYTSVLAHEATHALSKQFYSFKIETHAQDEYIAYASQLWSMNPATRERVLSQYALPQYAFSDELNINDLIHHSGPHAFGAMSYRHFTTPEAGSKMLHRIYSGDFKAPTMDMP